MEYGIIKTSLMYFCPYCTLIGWSGKNMSWNMASSRHPSCIFVLTAPLLLYFTLPHHFPSDSNRTARSLWPNSKQIPSRFWPNSKWILSEFQPNSKQIPSYRIVASWMLTTRLTTYKYNLIFHNFTEIIEMRR